MSGGSSRRKGVAWEREVVRAFAPLFENAEVRRGLQYRAGSEAPDVVVPGFWIECKVGRRTLPKAALAQAIEARRGKGVVPLAVCKDDRAAPTVTLHLADFLRILETALSRREERTVAGET